MRLEVRRSKKEILALFAAHAPFGGNVVGIDAASWLYFGRSPERLSWAEAAFLAVLPNDPGLVGLGGRTGAAAPKSERAAARGCGSRGRCPTSSAGWPWPSPCPSARDPCRATRRTSSTRWPPGPAPRRLSAPSSPPTCRERSGPDRRAARRTAVRPGHPESRRRRHRQPRGRRRRLRRQRRARAARGARPERRHPAEPAEHRQHPQAVPLRGHAQGRRPRRR